MRARDGEWLWADALLLSSHMDADTWKLVMSRFANETISAGRRCARSMHSSRRRRRCDSAGGGGERPAADAAAPAVVPRWREHLAMMLANPTAGDTEVIADLGDQAYAADGAAAAHCCFMVAELPPDGATAPPDSARMPLLGLDGRAAAAHGVAPHAEAVDAIVATEIYCYFRSRASRDFAAAVGRSPYELLLAHLLAEAGDGAKAAAYV